MNIRSTFFPLGGHFVGMGGWKTRWGGKRGQVRLREKRQDDNPFISPKSDLSRFLFLFPHLSDLDEDGIVAGNGDFETFPDQQPHIQA